MSDTTTAPFTAFVWIDSGGTTVTGTTGPAIVFDEHYFDGLQEDEETWDAAIEYASEVMTDIITGPWADVSVLRRALDAHDHLRDWLNEQDFDWQD